MLVDLLGRPKIRKCFTYLGGPKNMSRGDTAHEAPTRRDYVKYVAALGSTAGLAGCTGSSSEGNSTETESENESTETEKSTSTTTTAEEEPYTVNIEPAGKIEFQSVPEQWLSLKVNKAEMCFTLGQSDGLVATKEPSKLAGFERWWGQIPDVSFDTGDVLKLRTDTGVSREAFLEADPDINIIDPNVVTSAHAWNKSPWTEEESEQVSTRTGPFIGHYNIQPRPDVFPEYPMYTLYEEFEKYAQVFQRKRRYEQVKNFHNSFISRLQSKLPPKQERPTVGTFMGGTKPAQNRFDLLDFTQGRTGTKHYRDLGAISAFEDLFDGNSWKARFDYELMLEVDPDVILFLWGAEHPRSDYEEKFFQPLRNDERGQRLSAVQDDRLYMGADPQQGPITNLFKTEMLAKQLYPEQFGDWKGIGEHTEQERLFSRSQLGNILSS